MVEQSTEHDDGLMDSAWPMHKHDVRHTGRSPCDTSGNTGGERWKFEVMMGVESSAVIDKNGTIYFGSDDDKLYAVYPNGTEKWNCSIGDFIWVHSSPALASDGTIYIATYINRKLIAINPNGTVKWQFNLESSSSASPAIGDDGTVYIGSLKGKLYALYPNNGTLMWMFDVGDKVAVRSPAIGIDGTIYVTSRNTNLYALYPNGTLKWMFDTPGQFYSEPVIGDDGTIYITPNCGYLYAVNPDCTEKWRAKTTKDYLVTPALGHDGTIYVQCSFNVMDAFYPDGNKKWSLTVTESLDAIYSTPVVGKDGAIYIGVDEHLVAINPDGTIKWKTRLTSDRQPYDCCMIHTSPAIAEDGTIYIGTWFRGEGHVVFDWGYIHAIGGVKIQTPEEGNLYLFGRKMWSTLLGFTIVIGRITVRVSAFQQENVENVEFLIDGQTRYNDNTPPFEWTIKEKLLGRHIIQVKGYYNDGIVSTDELEVWKFF